MSLAAALLTPLVLLFPAAGAMPAMLDEADGARGMLPAGHADRSPAPGAIFGEVAESFRVQGQQQVRIEQHVTIRISPLSRPAPMPRSNFLVEVPPRSAPNRLVERDIGRCLPVASISGVQPDAGNRLILFLRDRRMVSAVLDRACRARDFYSGFYVDRTPDGRLCVDRDTLLSRSGANCRLTRLRQLIEGE